MATGRNRANTKISPDRGKAKPRRLGTGSRESDPRTAGQTLQRRPRGGNVQEKVIAHAFKLLAARPRSEGQMREKLMAVFLSNADAVEQCIVRLKEAGYIDDALLARSYASSRLSAKAIGRTRLSRELAAKRVSRSVIEETLDSVFDEGAEETLIDRAIQKRIRIHGRPSDRGSTKRMFDHLARLGFQHNLIMRKLRALKANLSDE